MPPASSTAAITGMAFVRASRNGPSAGCGAGVLTLSGMTLATWNDAVPPGNESALPSGPRRQTGGISSLISPGVQATTLYRTTHAPDPGTVTASPSGSATVVETSLPARMRQPAGAATVRSSRMVSPTVGLTGEAVQPSAV